MSTSFALTRGVGLLAAGALLVVSGCTSSPALESGSGAAVTALTAGAADSGAASDTGSAGESGTVFDANAVHEFSLEIDEDDYTTMLQTYLDTGDKEWISGTVSIDGQVFENAGLKLKGNSSLRGVSLDTAPESLPWRIELDEFVDGANLDGHADFVVRANSTETSLNEAVALDLLEAAGLASEHAVAARFNVNGSQSELRLVVQNLDGDWDEENFEAEGILYKADADGDYSDRGDDPEAYAEAFDVDAGEEDYTPLMDFLDFVNNASDEEFAEQLGDYLEVESFARYLAFQELIDNFDDIDGPGNNSYLRWDAETDLMTVVAWDHNLAFGSGLGGPSMGLGGAPGAVEGGEPPVEGELPEGFEPPGERELPEGFQPPGEGELPAGRGGGAMGGNILAERFRATEDFASLESEAATALQAELVDSGLAQETLEGWTTLLTDEAADLVTADVVSTEAAQIEAVLSGEVATQQGASHRGPGRQ